jgi:hypothetical protein
MKGYGAGTGCIKNNPTHLASPCRKKMPVKTQAFAEQEPQWKNCLAVG